MKGSRHLTPKEVSRLLSHADPRQRIICLSGLTFGLRVSEILALTFGHTQNTHIRIVSRKGSNNAVFPIPPDFRKALGDLETHYSARGIAVDNNTPLVRSQKGGPVSRQQACRMIRNLCRNCGTDDSVGIHSFRKTFVDRIWKKTGCDLAKTMLYSRHKSIASLQHYLKASESPDLILTLKW